MRTFYMPLPEEHIIQELKTRWVSRQELQAMLGGVSERTARSWVEDLNSRLANEYSCVLSTSSRKGYHIPSPYNQEDIALVNIAIAELKHKAISIFERRQALEDFTKYAASVEYAEENIQLSLF